jgi:hypothetical protein
VKRILRTLKIDEISGVDFPCQEGARMTIMKRREPELPPIEDQVAALAEKISVLRKGIEEFAATSGLDQPEQHTETTMRTDEIAKNMRKTGTDFQAKVTEIATTEKVSRSVAMSKAAVEFPDLYEAYQEAGAAAGAAVRPYAG